MAEDPDAPDVYEQLAELGRLKTQLDKADAVISDVIPAAESALDSLQLGVPISMKIADGEGWDEYLAFSKIGKKWRLCIERGPDDGGEPDDWTVTPLSDVARDRRADVLEYHLPKILEAAVREVKTKFDQRTRAIASTIKLVRQVKTYHGTSAVQKVIAGAEAAKLKDAADAFNAGNVGEKIGTDIPENVKLKKVPTLNEMFGPGAKPGEKL